MYHVFYRPLHIASKFGLVPVVHTLIEKGASVFALDENGEFLYDINTQYLTCIIINTQFLT